MKQIFTLYLVIASLSVQAQSFTNYTTADGLINNTVNCLAVDANDNLWFGTQEGISFFDGTTWTNYDVNSHPDLVNNTIRAIAIDSDGNLWFGTDFGLSKYDGNTWTTYVEADGLADNRVRYINQSPNGDMWFANNDGMSVFDGTSWTSYKMEDGLPFGGTSFVTFDEAGIAYMGTGLGGVYIFDGTSFTAVTEEEGLLNDKIGSIAIDEDNNKWIGTSEGITVLDENNDFKLNHKFIFELPEPDSINPIEDIQIASDGRVWVGVYIDYLVTEGGVSMLETPNASWVDYEVEDGLVGPVVRRLDIDSQDNVWVATSTGVTKIGNLPSSNFNINIQNAISIYPNPAATKLSVNLPPDLVGTPYQLYNAIGVLARTGTITEEQMNLDIRSLANGVYFLSIDRSYVKKVIIEK